MIAKGQARRVARQDAEVAAKIIAIQEKEIEELKARLSAAYAALFVFDSAYPYVDKLTGEIVWAIGKVSNG